MLHFKNSHFKWRLVYAAYNGNIDIIQLLIEAGKNEEEIFTNSVDALMDATVNDQLDIVKMLIQKNKALLNAIDFNGTAALLYAARRGKTAIVKFLLKEGASIDLVDLEAMTALMHAADKGHIEIIDLLLEAGADIEATDANEYTALDHARQNNHMPTAYRLLYALFYRNRASFEGYKLTNEILAFNFSQELQTNCDKKYKVIKSSFKLHAEPDPEGKFHFCLLPLEVVSYIKKLELQLWLQDFPDWYQFPLFRYMSTMPKTIVYSNIQPDMDVPDITDVTEIENVSEKMSSSLTLLYDTKSKKSGDNIKNDKKYEQNIDIELNNLCPAVLNLRLN